MKIIHHELHGDVIQPTSFNELLHEVCRPSGKYKHRVWMWRGQSDISWGLDSSAFRRLHNSTNAKIGDKNKQVIFYEKELLKQATHRGYRYENGRELSDFELLAKLRHHGAATRLVDFTRSALIAIWFVCCEKPTKSGLLVGLDTWCLGGYERELELRSYSEIVENLNNDTPITWEPPNISSRIAVQHSQLIYSKVSDSPSGSLIMPSEPEAVRKFSITKKVKTEALKILFEVFDISKVNIFPDIDGFAKANAVDDDINDMHRW